MTEEDLLSAAKLEEIGERALAFQRYIYRRAWGTYYAVWAAAFVAFALGGELPLQSLVPQTLTWIPFAAFYGGIGWTAGVATAWLFRNAHRTISLRRVVASPKTMGSRRWALVWVWWIGFYVVAFVSFTFFQSEALSILYAGLFAVEIFIYYWLRRSFHEDIPAEGRLALASYALAIVVSFVLSLFTSNFLLFGIVWGVTTAVWLFCALYALSHAPEELVELRY